MMDICDILTIVGIKMFQKIFSPALSYSFDLQKYKCWHKSYDTVWKL